MNCGVASLESIQNHIKQIFLVVSQCLIITLINLSPFQSNINISDPSLSSSNPS